MATSSTPHRDTERCPGPRSDSPLVRAALLGSQDLLRTALASPPRRADSTVTAAARVALAAVEAALAADGPPPSAGRHLSALDGRLGGTVIHLVD
jgi:hypothetical protein